MEGRSAEGPGRPLPGLAVWLDFGLQRRQMQCRTQEPRSRPFERLVSFVSEHNANQEQLEEGLLGSVGRGLDTKPAHSSSFRHPPPFRTSLLLTSM